MIFSISYNFCHSQYSIQWTLMCTFEKKWQTSFLLLTLKNVLRFVFMFCISIFIINDKDFKLF